MAGPELPWLIFIFLLPFVGGCGTRVDRAGTEGYIYNDQTTISVISRIPKNKNNPHPSNSPRLRSNPPTKKMLIPTLTTLLPLLLLADLTTAQSYSFTPSCTTAQRTRYEWRELSATNQKSFIDAVVCLKKRPSKLRNVGSPSLYDDFVYVHWKAQNEAHGNVSIIDLGDVLMC